MKNIFLSLVVSAVPAAASVSVVPATMMPGQLLANMVAPVVLPAASQMKLATLPMLAAPVMPMTSVAGPVVAPATTAKETLVLSAEKIGAANNADAAGTAMNASNALFDNAASAHDAAAVELNGSPEQIDALNAAVAEALLPFNGALKNVKLSFSKVATNDKRATQVAFSFDYSLIRPKGSASLAIKDFSYAYPDTPSAKPELNANISAKFNLLNVMTQEEINKLAPAADERIKTYLSDLNKRYGDAAKVEARITRKDTDPKGNITGLGLALSLIIDLSKLPGGVDPKDVLITDGQLEVSIGLNGIEISAHAVSNPNAKQFERDQVGLKEMLDKLLARDAKALREIVDFVKQIDEAADRVTSGKSKTLF